MNFDHRLKIRAAYKTIQPRLEKGERVSPYDFGIDWITLFSPIEDNVWGHIRYLGLPLYPQYPIENYFVDFADPYARIAIEVDSFEWHRDKEKDKARENKIRKAGWKVFRIPSWMTFTCADDYKDDDGKIDWGKYIAESSEGFLCDLYEDYFFLRREFGLEYREEGKIKLSI